MKNVMQLNEIERQGWLANLAGETLLPLDLAAPLLGKSVATLRNDVQRRPHELPALTRLGRRVFIVKKDLDAFRAARRVETPAAPGVKGVRHG